MKPTKIKKNRKQWCGRLWLNSLASNARANLRWKTKQSFEHSYMNQTELFISDCANDITLDFQHNTLREYIYSVKKVNKMIKELQKMKLAIYAAAKNHNLKVDRK